MLMPYTNMERLTMENKSFNVCSAAGSSLWSHQEKTLKTDPFVQNAGIRCICI